jgi:MFS family permease
VTNGALPDSRFGLSYFRLIRIPGAPTLAFWGMTGRLPIAMRSISCLILISAVTGSLVNAGVVSAAMVVSQGVVSPVIGWLADRYSQRRVLLATCPAQALGIALLVVSITFREPLWMEIAAAVITGCTAVSFGSFLLARWTQLAQGELMRTAYALESMLDEIVFLLGPLLVAVLVSAVGPQAGLVACGALTTIGSIAIASHRRSEPVIKPPAAEPAPGGGRGRVITRPGVQVLMACYAGTGLLLGAIDVTMIAFARERSTPWLGGVLLSLVAAGSFAGGAVWGAVDWRLPPERLLAITICLLTLGMVPLAFANSFFLMAFLAVVAGFALAPALISGTTLLGSLVPKGSLSEGFSWLTSTGAIGIALGTAAGGRMAGLGGSRYAAWTAVGGGIVALVLSTVGQPALRRKSAADPIS